MLIYACNSYIIVARTSIYELQSFWLVDTVSYCIYAFPSHDQRVCVGYYRLISIEENQAEFPDGSETWSWWNFCKYIKLELMEQVVQAWIQLLVTLTFVLILFLKLEIWVCRRAGILCHSFAEVLLKYTNKTVPRHFTSHGSIICQVCSYNFNTSSIFVFFSHLSSSVWMHKVTYEMQCQISVRSKSYVYFEQSSNLAPFQIYLLQSLHSVWLL